MTRFCVQYGGGETDRRLRWWRTAVLATAIVIGVILGGRGFGRRRTTWMEYLAAISKKLGFFFLFFIVQCRGAARLPSVLSLSAFGGDCRPQLIESAWVPTRTCVYALSCRLVSFRGLTQDHVFWPAGACSTWCVHGWVETVLGSFFVGALGPQAVFET